MKLLGHSENGTVIAEFTDEEWRSLDRLWKTAHQIGWNGPDHGWSTANGQAADAVLNAIAAWLSLHGLTQAIRRAADELDQALQAQNPAGEADG